MHLKALFDTKITKWLPLVGCFLGILCLLFGGVISQDKKENKQQKDQYYDVGFYTEALEKRIENLCLTIHGVYEAKVLLTLDCGTEYVYAQKIQQSGTGENLNYTTDYIILHHSNDDNTAQVMEIYPKIRGIAVVCTGGETIQTKQTIIDLLSAALGISSNRIKVAGT